MYRCKFYLFIIFSLVYFSSFAQENKSYRFHTFSPEGGFYYDGVTHIKQDKDGFIWILLENDLYRFDGYEYKRYFSYFKKSNNKNGHNFRSIAIDKDGKLFVALTDGLYVYNKLDDEFSKLINGNTSQLHVSDNNEIWMTKSNFLGKYDETNCKFVKLLYKKRPLTNPQFFVPENKGFFMLNWGRNIFRYNNETEEIKLFYAFKRDGDIKGICKINNTLWLLDSNNKFQRIDIPTGKLIEEVDFLSSSENLYSRMILADKNENIWIASQKGVYVFNTKNNKYQHYEHNKMDPFSLPNSSVWTLEEDFQNNIWIGTYSGGLSYVNLDRKVQFNSLTPMTSPLNQSLISGFAEDDTNFWVATEGGGINRINKQTNNFTYYQTDSKQNSISSDNVKNIIIDHNKDLWFATFRGGLGYFNPRENIFTHYTRNQNDSNSILVNNLRKLVLDSDSGFWIVYQHNKPIVSYYSFKKKSFTHYNIDKTDNKHYIFDMVEGGEGLLWIITHNRLYSMNAKNGEVKKIGLTHSSLLYGQAACVDANENLWIGTVGKGLIRYNTQTEKFTTFDEILKFNVSTIYSICLDNENSLWMGTDNGLFKYDPSENVFSRFDKKDGVLGQVFYPLAAFKSQVGKLYFGGTNGYTIVDPQSIMQNQVKPQAVISNFYIDNSPAKPNVSDSSFSNTISFPTEITLNYKQSNFGFTFTSDNYLVPEKNRFKYRLKKYDNRWIEVDAFNRNVFYSKVPAGTYTFEVMSANNDGIWGAPLQIKINRTPAPWFSWWANTIYGLVIILVIVVIARYYQNQKKLKLQLYLDNLNQEKKEEIHQSQLRFFTNISHDFRTPLSLISASVEKLREEGLKEYYYRILNGNTKRLLGLVNELMDFRTVENGKMPLQVSKANINHLIETFAFDFKDYATQHNIAFDINTDPGLSGELYIDKHVLEKVVMNLLNNAFKYTINGGSISIRTYTDKKNFHSAYQNKLSISSDYLPNNCFAVVISDTGAGIAKDALNNVFERYYKAKTENINPLFGTGIGLTIVKSLVLLHKGEITVYSESGKGTDFVVCFPSASDTYEFDELLNEGDIKNTPAGQSKETEVPEEDNAPEEFIEKDYIKDKRRILLAEDNEDFRNMLVDYLSADFEVIEAENGLVASNLLKKMRIDLIISDIMMPEKDGITLCKEVKKDIDVSHVPFVLLTAKAGLDSKLEGADVGADIYFEKPVDFKLLRLSIGNVFKQQQQMREYYSKNFFAESHELTSSQRENEFLKKFVLILDQNLDNPEMDVNRIAAQLSMSRSKLYNKIKGITGNSIIEFIKDYRLRKAAKLIIEKDLSMREVMSCVGFESQSYFSRAFKKEFGTTPSRFATKHKVDKNKPG
ncbi:two-component regulator propeller domain-containing protein [Sunxiuqinia elliptica]|uniref:histidine kinase n=1 Tax=Sunxiuqinia elliptica TaxID=655355 RepID=A0A4R6GSN6_9BACT|nr:two-component regulator propeller domain-containing protein [Sunxiuqinia elliptica]TDN98412.1 signal transduction histidine kinase [Sunxiuqinia elliptica]TDO60515.1 signal transduction histidine kinase [Sunxiuqinia elliptica]